MSNKRMQFPLNTNIKPLRIGIFIKFAKSGYSGGRMHALLMAEALSAIGHTVEIFCNLKPEFYDEFSEFSGHSKIILHENSDLSFNYPKKHYDWVVCIPHLGYGWLDYHYYLQVVSLALKCKSNTILLNFESASMFKTLSPFKRNFRDWENQCKFSKYTDLILSFTHYGNTFAMKDYQSFGGPLNFDYCYPAINSLKAKKYNDTEKKDQIIIFCRWNDSHKNSSAVLNILCHELAGYCLAIVVGSGETPDSFTDSLNAKSQKYGVSFQIYNKINEDDKFKLIAQSKAMLFLSAFEGFGLPPVEAQFCGVPCVCFDLPVLREVNKNGVTYVSYGDYDAAKTALIQALNTKPEQLKILQRNIHEIADFSHYALRLNNLLSKHSRRKGIVYHLYQRLKYSAEYVIVKITRLYRGSSLGKVNNFTTDLLESYIKLKWKNLSHELPTSKVAVFGAADYLTWLSNITYKDNALHVTGIISELADQNSIKVWGKPPVQASEFDVKNVDAIILATECFQDQYRKQCKKLYGKNVKTVDLYEGLPPGPYPKDKL